MAERLVKSIKRSIRVSAPGKVILFGEHSVVYGKQALALSVDLRTNLVLKPSSLFCLNLPKISVNRQFALDDLNQLWKTVKAETINDDKVRNPSDFNEERSKILRSFLKIDLDAELTKADLGLLALFHLLISILDEPITFSLELDGQIPVGSGLGSSAAYAVCLAASFLFIGDKLSFNSLNECSVLPLDKSVEEPKSPYVLSKDSLHLISSWALTCEKILHGNPSGIDNAVCTFGGCVSFKSGHMEQLQCPPLRVLLVNTKVDRNTKDLVTGVRKRYNRHESLINPILTAMDELAKSALNEINNLNNYFQSTKPGDPNHPERDIVKLTELQLTLNELIDMNQGLLETLGVSHPSLRRMVDIAQSFGLSAKLTGAGGGGFGIILLPLVCSETAEASSQLDYSSTQLVDASTQLTDTTSQLIDLSLQFTAVSSHLINASSQITDARSEITDASSQITDANSQITDESSQITDASLKIIDASSQLSDTSSRLIDASSRLTNASSTFSKAALQLTDASSPRNAGVCNADCVNQLQKEGYETWLTDIGVEGVCVMETSD